MSKSAAKEFELALARDVAVHFRDDSNFELKQQSLCWRTKNGLNVVALANMNKWSPFVSVAFYYGCRFDAAYDVSKSLTKYAQGMQISQFSVNRPLIENLAYAGPHSWRIDIRNAPSTLAAEVATAIRGMANPFFERFSDLRISRDAIASDDNGCFGANPLGWYSMLCMDAALGELDHFELWIKQLDHFYRKQAEAELDRLRQIQKEQSSKPLKNDTRKKARVLAAKLDISKGNHK